MQILIVSPVAPLRRSLQVMLERESHRVLQTETIDAAVSQLAANLSVDIVIVEWKLGAGTAMELQRRCHQIDRLADDQRIVPLPNFVILATPRQGAAQGESRGIVQEIQGFGFRDVFEKPVDRARLAHCLRMIASERSRLEPVSKPRKPAEPATQEVPAATRPLSHDSDARLECMASEIANLTNSLKRHDEQISEIRKVVQRLAPSTT
ncbi:MAG: hypothetical protein SFV23_22305 [Planctomycetaceae bacterium]|nr:hypothetical protein [Planctomycetaceae bacterium]